MKSIAIANLSILILTCTLMAQAPGWQPEKIPSFYPGNVAALKAYQNQDGEPVLGVISFDPTLQTYTVQVPYTEIVSVTEKDPATGEAIEKQVTVTKTRTEQRTRQVLVRKQSEIPLNEVQLWSISGKTLSAEEARRQLVKPKKCFLIKRRKGMEKIPVKYSGDPFFTNMFNDGLLVASYDPTLAIPVSGKTKPVPGTRWMPAQIPSIRFNDSAAVGLNSAQTDTIQVTLFPQSPEQYTEEYPLTVLVSETVTDPETGITKTVQKPKTETRKVTMTRMKTVPRVVELSINDSKFWNASGKLLTAEETRTALATKKRCFLLSYDPRGRNPGDPFFTEMFQEDVLLFWFDKKKIKSGE